MKRGITLDILVVDDEKWIRKGIMSKIYKSGLGIEQVYEATDGMNAIKVIDKHKPSIVLTDIVMPKMDGLELMEYTIQRYNDIKFIIISGYSEFEYAQKALNLGAKGYILKPITEEALFSTLDKALHLKRPASGKNIGINTAGKTDEIKKYIKNHFCEELTVKGIADIFGFNPDYLSNLFHKAEGVTLTAYITKVRLDKACRMLLESDAPVYYIAYKVGYNDYQYFHRVFKREKSMTPCEYRRKNATAQ